MKTDNAKVIEETKRWIESFIIRHRICPFAPQSFANNEISFSSTNAGSVDEFMKAYHQVLDDLKNNLNLTNGFLILENSIPFKEAFEWYERSNYFLELSEMDHLFQTVLFHPQFTYADKSDEDIDNYTNRSPYAMIHILRIEEVSKAVDYLGDDLQDLLDRNSELMRNLFGH